MGTPTSITPNEQGGLSLTYPDGAQARRQGVEAGNLPLSASGTLGALDDAVTLYLGGRRGVAVQIGAGDLVADIQAEQSIDGVTWESYVEMYPYPGFYSPAPWNPFSYDHLGYVSFLRVNVDVGRSWARVRLSAYTSGSVAVVLAATDTEPARPPLQLGFGPATTSLGVVLNGASPIAVYPAASSGSGSLSILDTAEHILLDVIPSGGYTRSAVQIGQSLDHAVTVRIGALVNTVWFPWYQFTLAASDGNTSVPYYLTSRGVRAPLDAATGISAITGNPADLDGAFSELQVRAQCAVAPAAGSLAVAYNGG